MKKSIISLVLIMALFFSLKAVPAYPNPVEYKLPDGSEINITLKGDEKVNWAETSDGFTILLNKDGFYEYAVKNSDGDLVTSGVRVNGQNSYPSNLKKQLRFSESQINILKQIWNIKEKESAKGFPATGNRKLICILMAFKDKAFTKTQSNFNALFNQVNYTVDGAKGSVKDLYLENSRNQLNLTTDVVGPFTASQNMAYYGNNTNGNPWGLISEAVTLADPSVNYANYDNDNDGTVDGIYVIFAGCGEEAGGGANTIWSHMSSINVTKDGKRISSYACSPEHQGGSGTSLTRIGVICHEFGHVMGSRDFYDTNGSTDGAYEGTGSWDLMAGGSWGGGGVTPAHMNPYNKVYLYKWATATTLASGQNVTVQNAEKNNSFYRINTNTTNEYYLLENRQKVGIDQAIPGHGLVIFHVDENNLSNQTAHQGLYPKSSGTVSSDKACFPGSDNKVQFTDATTPNMKSWVGANTGKPITNIVESNGVITFSFMGGPVVTGPAGYTKCANENQSYTLSGACDVAYGANGKFYYQYGKTGTINFNNSTFGDPIPGVAKYGFYKKVTVSSNDVLGFYTKQPIQNNWHAGVIEMSGSTMQWRNNAGVTWPLIPDLANGKLLTTSQCPYYSAANGKAFVLKTRYLLGRVIIDGFWFLDTFYSMSSNIALGKSTNQSSTACGGVSSRATDGNTSGVWNNNSVTHTDYNNGAWWWVDLGTNCDINNVILWNRTECAERLSNFHVDYLNQNGALVARKDFTGTAGSKTIVDLSATGVKFVVVQLYGTNYLSLAEVQVIGVASSIRAASRTDITEEAIPRAVQLAQNYPNPFNPTTTINFALPEAGSVKLAVMNAKGETVKVLASGNYQAGNHSFDFDGSGLNSGVYFYQLVTQENTITKKMMLVK